MATKTEKTKEQRIKSETTRLKGIFKDLDANKKKLVETLIKDAAFMAVEMEDLKVIIGQEGWVSEYQNGKDQWGKKKSPEADVYATTTKNYTATIKVLLDLVPTAKKRKSALESLRAE